jgi:hypothetical protein
MPRITNELLTLSNTQAKDLAGRDVTIGGVKYSFQDYDANHPGQPPWRAGAEGKAYPLVGQDNAVTAYLKFFSRPTTKRLERTAWLIGQHLHTWLPDLAAAPVLWTDTRRRGLHGAKIDFDFTAYLARAVPGETWLECKSDIADGKARFAEDLRLRCVKDLLLSLAALELSELVHGDLSPNNVIIDLVAEPNQPALYLIDFDAFFSPAAEANQAITVAEGGTYGTEGYSPEELAFAVAEGNLSVAPYSDRYGRDMLLLEFLLMGNGLPPDDALARWNREQLQQLFAAWQARSVPELVRTLCHLDPANVFHLNEGQRPTSVDLATGLGLSLPERRVLRRVTELPRPAHAMLGYRTSTGKSGSGKRRPPVKPYYRQQLPVRSRGNRAYWLGHAVAASLLILILLFFYFTAAFDPKNPPTPPTVAGGQRTVEYPQEKADTAPPEKPALDLSPMTVLSVNIHHEAGGTLVIEIKIRASTIVEGMYFGLRCFDKAGTRLWRVRPEWYVDCGKLPELGATHTMRITCPPNLNPDAPLVSSIKWTLTGISVWPRADLTHFLRFPRDEPITFEAKEKIEPGLTHFLRFPRDEPITFEAKEKIEPGLGQR